MNAPLMFDFEDFYSRIATILPNDCRICEIGVADGDSALYLAKELKKQSKVFKLFMVDSMDYGCYIQMKTIYQNIIKSGLGEYIEVIPKDSIEASKDFNDGYLDFVFIDSSHEYSQTKIEIPTWYKKVIDGGIIAGHDYNAPQVQKAVREIIPDLYKRNDIEGRIFEPERVLNTEDTRNHFGVWWAKKQWYINLNK